MKECFDSGKTVHYQGVTTSYDFPHYAKYNPPNNMILTAMDFRRDEMVEFESVSEKPSSAGSGYAFYRSVVRPDFVNLVNVSDLIAVETSGYFTTEEQEEYNRVLDGLYTATGINIDELI